MKHFNSSNLLDNLIRQLVRERSPGELALGYARYEVLRRLNPRQFQELHRQNMKGENFDEMVDSLVLADTRPGDKTLAK